MTFKLPTKYIIIALFALFLTSGVVGYIWGHRNGDNSAQATVDKQKGKIREDSIIIANKTVFITQYSQEIQNLNWAKHNLEITNEELRKLNIAQLNELTQANATINILKEQVTHNGQVVTIHDTIKINSDKKAIILPFDFSRREEFFNLKGHFDGEGKMFIDTLQIMSKIKVLTGIQKKTFAPIVTIESDNPHLKFSDVQSVKMDSFKPKKYGIGIQFGYGISLSGTIKCAPYVGVGLSYNFIRF